MDFIPLKNLSPTQVINMLLNLNLSQLVDPFQIEIVRGELLVNIECYEDVMDIHSGIAREPAVALFNYLTELNGRVPNTVLVSTVL